MTELAKAIRTLQELPSNKNTTECLQETFKLYPEYIQSIAIREVDYQLGLNDAELNAYGYAFEKNKVAKQISYACEVLERHGYTITSQTQTGKG